jgi:hypothetical protein
MTGVQAKLGPIGSLWLGVLKSARFNPLPTMGGLEKSLISPHLFKYSLHTKTPNSTKEVVNSWFRCSHFDGLASSEQTACN